MTEFCNYELIGELGHGGMGTVYRARNSDGRVVALKVMRPELRGNLSAEARFRRAPKLYPQHPNIVEIYDAGECNGTLYFAMQLVEGESFSAIVHRARSFAPEQYTPVLHDVAAALDAAHARGVIHRDIKPSNILIRASDGRAILTDFDIAKDLAATQFTSVGATGQMIGTAHYMSPEQAGGKPLTPASDVYALGAMTYEVLSGRPPFVGDSEFAVARMHLQDTPVDLHKVNPHVPPNVSAVVMRALRKDPRQRYSTAGGFAQAYAQAAGSHKIAFLPRGLAVAAGLAALLVIAAVGVAVISSAQQDSASGAGSTTVPTRVTNGTGATTIAATKALATPDPLGTTGAEGKSSPTLEPSPSGPVIDQPTSTLAAGAVAATPSPAAATTLPTDTATVPPTQTFTPKPTKTPKPTRTPTPTVTPTPTDTPTPHIILTHPIILTLRVPPIRITVRPILIVTPQP